MTPSALPAGLPDLDAALREKGLLEFFDGCTAAHRREYIRWISEAKKAETRDARIAKAVVMIASRKKEEESKKRK